MVVATNLMVAPLRPSTFWSQALSEAENARLRAAGGRHLRPACLPTLTECTDDKVSAYVAAAERAMDDEGTQQQAVCTLSSLVPMFGLADEEARRRCRVVASTAVPWIRRVLERHVSNASIVEHGLFLMRRVSGIAGTDEEVWRCFVNGSVSQHSTCDLYVCFCLVTGLVCLFRR